jgi:hypothetical protein
MPVKGGYLFMAGGGAILAYSGLKGKSLSSAFRNLIKGQSPATASKASTEAIQGASGTTSGGGGTGSNSTPVNANLPVNAASIAAYKAYAQVLLTAHGWPGQFAALNNIFNAESGWNNRAYNSGSGALGIAQALGHGTSATSGSMGNQYGGYGTSDAICKAANNGNGYAQIVWGLNYVGEAYGSPNAAWAFHQANGYY